MKKSSNIVIFIQLVVRFAGYICEHSLACKALYSINVGVVLK